MAQGAAMRNGTPMRLVSPAPVLVQPQAANRQNQAAAAAAAVSLYSSTPQSLYGANVNTSVNGTTLGGRNCLHTYIYISIFFLIKYSFSVDVHSLNEKSSITRTRLVFFLVRTS